MEEDAEIARGFAEREAWAYEAAYRVHGAVLYAAAFGVLRDRLDAQDCVHDAILRLWHRSDAFLVQRGTLRAFLAVCVRNEALSRARKQRNRERVDGRTAERPAARDDVASRVVQSVAMSEALAGLNEQQRQTIVLAYYERLTHEEIAARLGEPLGTIKSRLSSALRRLRATFEPEEPAHVRR